MRLQENYWREPWMTEEEYLYMKRLLASLRRLFKTSGVRESPLVCLRAVDVGVHCLLARRLEQGLTPAAKENGEAVLDVSGALADHIGKTRERLRKAIRELEDACTRLGAPLDTGLAEQMLPLVRKTQDLLHGVSISDEQTTINSCNT
ncbi:MAG TPA: hypothetical protein ENN29_10595 [Candidatus Hydrogenedentes bacterium]|nr:hypothetical protein [Candidatus Hydrogenedentota bacterium]